MKINFHSIGTVALAVCLLLCAQTAVAEVSLQGDGSQLFLQGRDGRVWTPVRLGIPGALLLNPGGDLRGDQFGDWSTNPITGLAEVVWTTQVDGQYEVMFSRFEKGAWLPPVQVSRSPANDLSPRLIHDYRGTRYVYWTSYSESETRVWLAIATLDAPTFGLRRAISDVDVVGKYPHAIAAEHSILSVHEEDDGEARYLRVLEIPLYYEALRSTPMENPFERGTIDLEDDEDDDEGKGGSGLNQSSGTVLSAAASLGGSTGGVSYNPDQFSDHQPSDPRIHLEQETLWVDWLQNESRMGYSVFDGADFTKADYIHLRGPADVDAGRQRVRSIVLGGRGGNR